MPWNALSLRRTLALSAIVGGITLIGINSQADEIRLKDGKKIYGVIVAYEDNMFKVKTDYGFVLVEKDKIAAIIPTTPTVNASSKPEPTPAAPAEKPPVSKPGEASPRPASSAERKEDRTVSNALQTTAGVTAGVKPPVPSAGSKSAVPANNGATPASQSASNAGAGSKNASTVISPKSPEKKPAPAPAPVSTSASAAGTVPSKTNGASAPATVSTLNAKPAAATSTIPVVTAVQPATPKPPASLPNREALEGNVYVNYTHGFRMYKPPSWKLIDDARKTIPNAIVAMGTADESTLMVVAQEKTTNTLEVTAADVESRLRDTYGNYRRISQRKTVAGGFPAIEIQYRGIADDHDWSGTLLIVARSGDMFSIVGMTYSGTDLIQIQENVIARAIASLEFNQN
jgi:hypothetical protein